MDSKPIKVFQFITEPQTTEIISGVVKAIIPFFNQKDDSVKEEEKLLTVEETLKFLKCSKQSLWTWRKNGILPSYRLGNRVYYKKSDIFNKLIKQE
jgi:predicted DNA-binding transcriptional regulator AlpA